MIVTHAARRLAEKYPEKYGWVLAGQEATPPPAGPGTELKALLASVGITPQGCGCNSVAADMDRGGVAWCREHRAELVEHLKTQAESRTWLEKAKAGVLAVASGLAFRIDPTDVFGSLVDEAIRRAEEKK